MRALCQRQDITVSELVACRLKDEEWDWCELWEEDGAESVSSRSLGFIQWSYNMGKWHLSMVGLSDVNPRVLHRFAWVVEPGRFSVPTETNTGINVCIQWRTSGSTSCALVCLCHVVLVLPVELATNYDEREGFSQSPYSSCCVTFVLLIELW